MRQEEAIVEERASWRERGCVALYGGSFDPPHQAHRALLESLSQLEEVEEVLVLPAKQNPLKQGLQTPAAHRLQMAKLAFSDLPKVRVLDLELRREGPSYTLDSLRSLRKLYPDGQKFVFVMGADAFLDFPLWYQAKTILTLCDLWVARRPGLSAQLMEEAKASWDQEMGREVIFWLEAPLIELSSTQLRTELLSQLAKPAPYVPRGWQALQRAPLQLEGLRGKLAQAVLDWIQIHGLYAYQNWGQGLKRADLLLCQALQERLFLSQKPERLWHCLNVYLLAVALAPVFGLGEREAALAALLHDGAKHLNRQEMLMICPELQQRLDLSPAVWHGWVAAKWAREEYQLSEEVALAIEQHSTLAAGASPLAQLIFVVDKVEPARKYGDLEEIRQFLEAGKLEAAARLCLQSCLAVLEREGKPAAKESLEFLAQGGECQSVKDLNK